MQYDILQGLSGFDALTAAGDALIPGAIGFTTPVAAAVMVDKFLPTQAKYRHLYGMGATALAAGITYLVKKNRYQTVSVAVTGLAVSGLLMAWEMAQEKAWISKAVPLMAAPVENPPVTEGLRGRYVENAAQPLFAGRYQTGAAQPLFAGNGMGEVVGLGTNPGVFVSN